MSEISDTLDKPEEQRTPDVNTVGSDTDANDSDISEDDDDFENYFEDLITADISVPKPVGNESNISEAGDEIPDDHEEPIALQLTLIELVDKDSDSDDDEDYDHDTGITVDDSEEQLTLDIALFEPDESDSGLPDEDQDTLDNIAGQTKESSINLTESGKSDDSDIITEAGVFPAEDLSVLDDADDDANNNNNEIKRARSKQLRRNRLHYGIEEETSQGLKKGISVIYIRYAFLRERIVR